MSFVTRFHRKVQEGKLLKSLLHWLPRTLRRLQKELQVSNSLYWLSPARILTRRFMLKMRGVTSDHRKYGNYFLDQRIPLDANSVVYSLGVGSDIDFDRELVLSRGCLIHLYDPTPSSIKFIESIYNEGEAFSRNLKFHRFGAWTEDTRLTFFTPKYGGSSSAVNKSSLTEGSFEADCLSLETMMTQNGHREIDVLKMDIEGAAVRIMKYLLTHKIFPKQIVAEFERYGRGYNEAQAWCSEIEELCSRFQASGYEITALPRDRARYFGVELLFVRV